ncbi:hypothetical protein L6452_23449 [Arctium lappa]|uniref:Uncharacterized protein n=1 Tax=Arctium lappa TaxID=4217 RepID=A0ACB9B2R9_ARCLA|nr:hypothetical protein L6452_23449 [Arctium lappa]
MKISSKSILSPARAGGASRDPPNTLPTSLSRRLKTSGSIKGGASPAMFPTTAKKRATFENPEPSSPKVTCIGQVRVKSKKNKAKKLKTLSRKHTSGEVTFRKPEHHHPQIQESWPAPAPEQKGNPRWVHFPVTICDALRAFGSEFSCLFPCRKEEKVVADDGGGNRHGSCGTVFARWLVAVQDGGGERDIELVVEEEMEEKEESFKKPRRHVFEDLEIINDRIIEGDNNKDESRMSVCIPPKNALLLMRCRSDPMKMEALTKTRSCEPTIDEEEQEEEEVVENEDQILQETIVDSCKKPNNKIMGSEEDDNVQGNEDQILQETIVDSCKKTNKKIMGFDEDQDQVQENDNVQENEEHDDDLQQDHDDEQENPQQNQDQEHGNVEQDEVFQVQDNDNVEQDEVFQDQEFFQDQDEEQTEENDDDEEEESMNLGFLFEEKIMDQDSEMEEVSEEDEDVSTMGAEFVKISETHEGKMVMEVEECNNGVLERESEVKEGRESEVLPECLLMMMKYEPKLSMELSKETWVCSTDFIRRQSNKRKPPAAAPVVKPDGGDESRVSVTATDYGLMRVADGGCAPVIQYPARRLSCSFPAAPSMAAMLEQKLADAMGYEPFVLTRCKSEPMKTAAAKLLPETCVWENRKSKRLSGVGFGVGAAGLGF